MTARGKIIRLEEIVLVYLSTNTGATITLKNITYTLRYDSNFISLGQLRELGITYYDHFELMILKQRRNSIGSGSKYRIFFILVTKIMNKKGIITPKEAN